MQTSGTEAIRAKIQLSKPKREITKITNSQNTKGTYNGGFDVKGLSGWLMIVFGWTRRGGNKRFSTALVYSVGIYSNKLSSLFHHRVDFCVSLMML